MAQFVRQFTYKGRRCRIQDMGESYRQNRYWYTVGVTIRECAGSTLDGAIEKVKADIDLAETLPIIPPNYKVPREKKIKN